MHTHIRSALVRAGAAVGLTCLLLGISACLPAANTPPPETATPEPTASPTTVWFPPTSTYTPAPAALTSPTPLPREGVGGIILDETFSDPAVWTDAASEGGGARAIIVSDGRLTLVVNSPPAYLFTFRSGLPLDDFYAEAAFKLNRCQAGDRYGLLFRADGGYDGYRFNLDCSGQARLERLRGGEAYPLSDWVTGLGTPRGAPGEARLEVWVSGRQLRVFINDTMLFEVSDPIFPDGSLGLFVSARSDPGMNISVGALQVRQLQPLAPTSTASPRP